MESKYFLSRTSERTGNGARHCSPGQARGGSRIRPAGKRKWREARLEHGFQHARERVMDHAISEGRGGDLPWFWIEYLKGPVGALAVAVFAKFALSRSRFGSRSSRKAATGARLLTSRAAFAAWTRLEKLTSSGQRFPTRFICRLRSLQTGGHSDIRGLRLFGTLRRRSLAPSARHSPDLVQLLGARRKRPLTSAADLSPGAGGIVWR